MKTAQKQYNLMSLTNIIVKSMAFHTLHPKNMSQWTLNNNFCQTVLKATTVIKISTQWWDYNIKIQCRSNSHNIQCITRSKWTTFHLNNLKECLGILLWINFHNICTVAVIKIFNNLGDKNQFFLIDKLYVLPLFTAYLIF